MCIVEKGGRLVYTIQYAYIGNGYLEYYYFKSHNLNCLKIVPVMNISSNIAHFKLSNNIKQPNDFHSLNNIKIELAFFPTEAHSWS